MEQKEAIKERILKAAMELLETEGDVPGVSMRRIARRADVAVSMINYHYQSKDNLMVQAVERYIAGVIGASSGEGGQEDSGTIDGMRKHLKRAAAFVALNPGISRVSIFQDLEKGSANDNSSRIASSVLQSLRKIYGERKSETELKLLAFMQVAAVQQLFLRAEVFFQETGLDFFKAPDRDRIADMIIDIVAAAAEGSET
jgi:AcrR family transcriptional regulator